MFRKLFLVVFSVLFLINIYGCIPLLAGAAAGGGTATWLSGKLTQDVNASFDRTYNAAKSAIKSLGLVITKETKKADVGQIRSKYTDGDGVWIDVHPISASTSRVGVRVGVTGNGEAERKIMNQILRYL